MSYITSANFSHLSAHVRLLDAEVVRIYSAVKVSRDPVSDGLCDRGEYFIGHGFIAIQVYVITFCAHTGTKKSDALKVAPMVTDDLSLVEVVNAAANYHKHLEEWGLKNIVERNTDELKGSARNTILTIEKLTPWDDYTCSNLLAVLLGSKEFQLSLLLPKILEWQDNLMKTST